MCANNQPREFVGRQVESPDRRLIVTWNRQQELAFPADDVGVKARARGLERDRVAVRACVARGLAVVQGDAETDLSEFPSGAFEYVIFSHTLLQLPNPREALKQAGRIGERVIVTVRNAAYWRRRYTLSNSGRTVAAKNAAWADGALERRASIRDFADLARDMRFNIETAVPLTQGRPGAPFAKTLWRANYFAEEAVLLLNP
jgi:methionine biosynthesis protein MetW